MRQLANHITGCRIVCSVLLLFRTPFSFSFWLFYLLAGFSDMVDGFVARKTGAESPFGAKFDSVADSIFVVVVLWKLLPLLYLPSWLLLWTMLIAILKIAVGVHALSVFHQFVSVHSFWNKLTGLLLFLLPFFHESALFVHFAGLVAFVASLAALNEGRAVLKKKNVV